MTAISASINTPFGVPATWWAIATITYDFIAQETTVLVVGYASEDAYRLGSSPLGALTPVLPAEDCPLEAGSAAVCAALARLPVFSSVTPA